MPEEELVELKFRLYDGSDIGPFQYSPAATIAMLKERIVAEWPKDKKIAPKAANDVKLISGGKILENNKSVSQCKPAFGELPKGVITMHAVVQPSVAKTKTEDGLFHFCGTSGIGLSKGWSSGSAGGSVCHVVIPTGWQTVVSMFILQSLPYELLTCFTLP